MSSDIWYHELLTKNIVMSKSDEYHPHYNIDTKESEYPYSDDVITKPKCTLEFNKPLITSYRCLVSNIKGFTMKQLCEKISVEWKNICTLYSEWIDKNVKKTNIISDIYICDDEYFTRVIINFSIPLSESTIFTNQEIAKLQFIAPKPIAQTQTLQTEQPEKQDEKQPEKQDKKQPEKKEEKQIQEAVQIDEEQKNEPKKRKSEKRKSTNEPPTKKTNTVKEIVDNEIDIYDLINEQILQTKEPSQPKDPKKEQKSIKKEQVKTAAKTTAKIASSKTTSKTAKPKTSITDLIEKYK